MVQLLEAALEAVHDVEDLVADGALVHLHLTVVLRELAEQGLGDLLAGRQNRLARSGARYLQRNLLTQQAAGELLRQLVNQVGTALLVVAVDLLALLLALLLQVGGGGTGGAGAHNTDVHHHARRARRHAQRGVLHVSGLLTEDGAQQALLRSKVGLALGGNLTHEDVAGLHLGTDAHHAVRSEVLEGIIAHVRDIAGDFLRPELGIASLLLEFLDVDGRVGILLRQALGDDDGVLEVVAVPGHVSHQHVATQSQLTAVGAGAVSQHITGLHGLPALHDGMLVDAGGGIGAHELAKLVDVDALLDIRGNAARLGKPTLRGHRQVAVRRRHDVLCRGGSNDTRALGADHGATVAGALGLNARAHQRSLVHHQRHTLALHVGTHQSTVGVIVLQEGNETGGDGDNLLGGDVHVLHLAGVNLDELALGAGRDAALHEVPRAVVAVQLVVGLGDHVVLLLVRRQVIHLIGHDDLGVNHLALLVLLLHVLDAAERCLDEAVLINAGIGAQRVDQTDVRTFRGLNRADTAVVRGMHVSHLEAGAVAVQTARAEGREAALVRQLSQRVDLVHELGKLAATEEVAHDGTERLRVDELAGRQVLFGRVAQGHTLLHQTLRAGKAHAALVGNQLTHGTHAAAAQVVDVVHLALSVLQLEHVFDGRQEVNGLDETHVLRHVQTELLVDLVATDAGQVVLLLLLEQAVQSRGSLLHGGRITGAELAENLLESGLTVVSQVLLEGLDEGLLLALVNDLDFLDAQILHATQSGTADGLVGLGNHVHAGVTVLHILKGNKVLKLLARHILKTDALDGVELLHQLAVRFIAQIAQESRGKELATAAAAIQEHVHQVAGVKLYLQPRAAIRDDAEGEDVLAIRVVRLLKADARGTVQLGHDNTLRTVDDEGAAIRDHGNLAHVHVLLRLVVRTDNAELHVQRGTVRLTCADGRVVRHLRRRNFVGNVLQTNVVVVTLNREILNKDGLETHFESLVGFGEALEEFLVGLRLNLDQVGRFNDLLDLTETNSLLCGL